MCGSPQPAVSKSSKPSERTSPVSRVPRVPGPSCPGSTRAPSSHEGREGILLCFASPWAFFFPYLPKGGSSPLAAHLQSNNGNRGTCLPRGARCRRFVLAGCLKPNGWGAAGRWGEAGAALSLASAISSPFLLGFGDVVGPGRWLTRCPGCARCQFGAGVAPAAQIHLHATRTRTSPRQGLNPPLAWGRAGSDPSLARSRPRKRLRQHPAPEFAVKQTRRPGEVGSAPARAPSAAGPGVPPGTEHPLGLAHVNAGTVLFFSFSPRDTPPTAYPNVSRRCQLLVHKCILGKKAKWKKKKKNFQFITCNHIYKYINIYIKKCLFAKNKIVLTVNYLIINSRFVTICSFVNH